MTGVETKDRGSREGLVTPDSLSLEGEGLLLKSEHEKLHTVCRFEKPDYYPERVPVPDDKVSWNAEFPGYNPPTIFSPKAPTPHADSPYVTFEKEQPVDADGRRLNPHGRTGMEGSGEIWLYGPSRAGDPLVVRLNPNTELLEMVFIERSDNGKWALPGGFADGKETPLETIAREFQEETGNAVDFTNAIIVYQGYVDDFRNTDHAWMETTAALVMLDTKTGMEMVPKGQDDAKDAKWAALSSEIMHQLHANHALMVTNGCKVMLDKFGESLTDKAKAQLEKIVAEFI